MSLNMTHYLPQHAGLDHSYEIFIMALILLVTTKVIVDNDIYISGNMEYAEVTNAMSISHPLLVCVSCGTIWLHGSGLYLDSSSETSKQVGVKKRL
jgi:hypothetical protein